MPLPAPSAPHSRRAARHVFALPHHMYATHWTTASVMRFRPQLTYSLTYTTTTTASAAQLESVRETLDHFSPSYFGQQWSDNNRTSIIAGIEAAAPWAHGTMHLLGYNTSSWGPRHTAVPPASEFGGRDPAWEKRSVPASSSSSSTRRRRLR